MPEGSSREACEKLRSLSSLPIVKVFTGVQILTAQYLKYPAHVFVYFPFDHFPKSKIYSKITFEMKMSIFLF